MNRYYLIHNLYQKGSINLGKFVIQQNILSHEITMLFVMKFKESIKKFENKTLGELFGQLKGILKCRENAQLFPSVSEFIQMLDEYNTKRNKLIHKILSANFWIEIKDSKDIKTFEESLEDLIGLGENIRKNIKVLSN